MAGKRDEVTIAEVAEALNISKTTVSRAISGKGRVSEATRARVFDYIGKGRQDAAAPLRTAQQGPTNNLALVIPKHFMRLDLPFLRKCMGGVWNMAAQRGYDLLLCYAGETDVGQLERQLESHKVDGVILSRTMLHDECVQTLQRHNVPFVAIGRVDDSMAAAVLQELRARHIKVPEQVKLASFYDSELLTSSTPQISAAQFDGERLGATACRMLLDILAGKQIALRQMQGYQVILRESTK